MNHCEFNFHCVKANLPALDDAQWTLLTSTLQGSLIQIQRNEDIIEWVPSLELMVRSVSQMAQDALKCLGLVYNAQKIIDVAERDQMKLFIALHKSKTDRQAHLYIQSLGFAVVPKIYVEPPYYSFHVYGNSAALCFSEAQTRSNKRFTVNIEGALALSKTASQYDWGSKIIVQLSPEELFLVLAVLNGKLDQVHFSGHGVQHDKVVEIHQQQKNYFIRLIQKGRSPVSVPMPVSQGLNLTSLLYQQIKKNHPHLGMDEMKAMEEQLVRMHKTAA